MAEQLEQKGKQMKVQNLPVREIPGNEAAGVGGREALKNGTKREFLGIFAQKCTKMHGNALECARVHED